MKEIQCGVIGAGYFGKHYIRNLQEIPGIKLRAIAAASDRTLSSYPLPASVAKTRRWEDIVENREIGAVVIATPPSTHFPIAAAAIKAGKHVLLEKPMTPSLREASTLAKLARKHKHVFLVGHQYLYNDYVQLLKKAIEEKKLGKIRYILAENLYFGPIRNDIGCFWETATHELALIDYLFEPKKVVGVRGMSQHFFDKARDDFSVAAIKLPSGIMATIVASWWAAEKTRKFIIGGDKGFAVFDDVTPEEKLKFFFYPYPQAPKRIAHTSTFLNKTDVRVVIPKVAAGEPLRNQLLHFQSCIGSGTEPRTGIEHGLRVTKMLDAIARAIR